MKAKLERIEKLTDHIHSFWFKPDKTISYIAGQFIQLELNHPSPDDRGVKRWFTLSSSPTDSPLVSITTKLSDGSSSFKKTLFSLKPKFEIEMSEPMGDFVLPKDSQIPLVFVAGGIGLTPFHSIIKWLYDTKQERDITFLYSVSTEEEIIFQDLFEKYGIKRTIVVNQPAGQWDGETGRLTGQRIIDLTKPKNDSLIYISGPEPMVEALGDSLRQIGIPDSRLVQDFFPGYKAI